MPSEPEAPTAMPSEPEAPTAPPEEPQGPPEEPQGSPEEQSPDEHRAPSSGMVAPTAPADDLPRLEGQLHPATLVLVAVAQLRQLLLVFVPLLVFGGARVELLVWMVALSFPPLLAALTRFFTFRWSLGANELSIGHGLLLKVHRSIRVDRIQNIDVRQGPLQRLLGVAELAVETASGSGVEARLAVLSRERAEELRDAVRRARAAVGGVARAEPVPEDRPLFQLDLPELLMAGLSRARLGPVLVLLTLPFQLVQDFHPQGPQITQRWVEQLSSWAAPGGLSGALAAVGALVALLVMAMLLSVFTNALLFGRFSLARSGAHLRRQHGLLTLRSGLLPLKRIQLLRIDETLLGMLLGRLTVEADTAGSPVEGETPTGRDTLLPVLPSDELGGFLPLFLAGFEETFPPRWQRVSQANLWLNLARMTLLLLVGALFLRRWWPLVLLPLALPIAWWRHRLLGFHLGQSHFFARRGWLARRTFVVPLARVQGVHVARGPVDRMLGLASLVVDTAGQSRVGGVVLPDLPLGVAQWLAERLGRASARTELVW